VEIGGRARVSSFSGGCGRVGGGGRWPVGVRDDELEYKNRT